MKFADRLLPFFVVGVLVLGLGTIAVRWIWPEPAAGDSVRMPALSTVAVRGQDAFNAVCAECHGANAAGTVKGPPLVHDIYNPGHHNDDAFFRAAKQGVPQHHWPFGNMPAQPKVTDEQLAAIVGYVRELQEANGIFYRPHTM